MPAEVARHTEHAENSLVGGTQAPELGLEGQCGLGTCTASARDRSVDDARTDARTSGRLAHAAVAQNIQIAYDLLRAQSAISGTICM